MNLQRRLRLVSSGHEEAVMGNPLYIAFATSDMKHVNQHFGAAKCFAIYALDQQGVRFVEAAQFSEHNQDGHEAKLVSKLRTLQGCTAVYCQAVGSSAISQLLRSGIQPVKVDTDIPIAFILNQLKSPELESGAYTSWLTKARSQRQDPDPKRFDKMEFEGWNE